jgi:hypothetical protein
MMCEGNRFMNITRVAPQFGAIKTSTVKYQPQDQEVTVITRQTTQGGKKEEKQVKDIPFYLSFQFSATEAGDKVYQTVSGLTESDTLNKPVSAKLIVTSKGHLKLETDYSVQRQESYEAQEEYEGPNSYYVNAGDEVAPYCRASSSYWVSDTRYRTVTKYRTVTDKIAKTLEAKDQASYSELYRFMSQIKDQSEELGAAFKDIAARGGTFLAGAKDDLKAFVQSQKVKLKSEIQAKQNELREQLRKKQALLDELDS